MKNVLILILLLCSWVVAAQPNPDLFQTWYPQEVLVSDEHNLWFVSEINPPVFPNLTIYEDHSYEVVGVCNTVNGVYEFPDPNNIGSISFNETTEDCGLTLHNLFERDYFDFVVSMGWYQIEEDGTGQRLTVSNPIMGYAIFTNYPLSHAKFEQVPLQIYPNPIRDILHFKTEQETITVRCYSVIGTVLWVRVLEGTSAINISHLPSGMYLLFWDTETTKGIHRIVKQ